MATEVQVDAPPLEELRRRTSAKWRTFPADVLPCWVAESDFPLAAPVAQSLQEAVARSDTGYASSDPALATALAGFAQRRWGWAVDPCQVSYATDVSVGATELLRQIVGHSGRRGVVIDPPVYPPFFDWPGHAGGHPVEVPLAGSVDGGWRLDVDALGRAFAGGDVAAYVLCSPHNPVGRVHDRDELVAVAALARRYDVVVLADEIHAPLTLAGAQHTPYLSVSEDARRCGVALVSASKTWNLAGLKCAQVVTASEPMQALVARVPEDVRWRTGHLGAVASTAAYRDGGAWLDGQLRTLDRNRRLLADLLDAALPGAGYRAPEAGYLAWLDLRGLGWGEDPAVHLLEHGRVALSPGPDFGREGVGFARLNIGTSAEIVAEAVRRMAGCVADATPY